MTVLFLKTLRAIYKLVAGQPHIDKPLCTQGPELASKAIKDILLSEKPAMIARLGSTELTSIANYVSVVSGRRPWLQYIKGTTQPWWWNEENIRQMAIGAGFFPAEIPAIEEFCELMLRDMTQVDLLGSWLPMENQFAEQLRRSQKVDLELLNPYFSTIPWTRALTGKKVLVIHPFASSIEAQYLKRKLLFQDDLLPDFDLKTIKAVQSIAGEKTEFSNWFAALDSMKIAMDKCDYDICLVGCGAYGFPLAAHAKRMGKKGFHLGGSLQLLFGIRGKRWENPAYNPIYNYSELMNEHWIKPSDDERPISAHKVEGACYW